MTKEVVSFEKMKKSCENIFLYLSIPIHAYLYLEGN
jgi:hypothetical protein